MQFANIIGQEPVKASLIKTVREGRIGHAQLFLGPEGSGNLALAVAYAAYIACTARLDNDACGQCASCLKMAKGIHPDVHFVFPIASVKEMPLSSSHAETWRKEFFANPYLSLANWNQAMEVENKQTLIAVKESEEITRKVHMMAYEAPFNFVIIWMPGKMNAEAANKLLKVLEEPPGKSVFILVEQDQEELLPTIQSRLLTVKIPRLKDEDVVQALIKSGNCAGNEAERIAYLADGDFNRALHLLLHRDEEGAASDHFIQWSRLCFGQSAAGMIDWVEGAAQWGREKQKHFLQYAIRMIRENLLLSLGIHDLVRLEEEEMAFSKRFHSYITRHNAGNILDLFTRAHMEVERNANPRILFLDLSFDYGRLLKEGRDTQTGARA